MIGYKDFVEQKRRRHSPAGFPGGAVHPSMFPHQADITRWACMMGRAAIFADTGLGKTRMQVQWARNVAAHTDQPVLILAPLAVGAQTILEGAEIGASIGDAGSGAAIEVTNYERLHRVDVGRFGGVVLDESSILKAYDGKTRTALIDAFADTPYRLACTATPAPNDHTELGNHAEFLGVCTMQEMLAEFFVHDSSSSSARGWRIKGHARDEFWRWVASWAVVVRMPSDLGHEDGLYSLPDLRIHTEIVDYDASEHRKDGMLFAVPAATLADQRSVRRGTIAARVARVAELAAGGEQVLVWCELNDESAMLAKAIPGAVEVTGSMPSEDKAAALLAFARGEVRALVTKPSIAGFGMNWQGCSRMAFVGVGHSYEQFYQAVRRCWRFGQTRPVDVHIVQTSMDGAIAANLERKARAADEMAREMVSLVRDEQMINVKGARPGIPEAASMAVEVPAWLDLS